MVAYHDNTFSPVINLKLNGDLTDSSGNGLDLTGATARYTEIIPGMRGLYSPGTGVISRGSTDAALQLTGDVSIAFLYAVRTISNLSRYIVNMHIANGASTGNTLYAVGWRGLAYGTSGQFAFRQDTGTQVVNQAVTSAVAVGLGVAHHIVAVRSSNVWTLYIDSVLTETMSSLPTPTGGSLSRLSLFSEINAAANNEGVMASLCIYNTALTAGNVTTLFDRTLGDYYPVLSP